MLAPPRRFPPPVPYSGVPGVVWPALPSGTSALVLALLQQFDESQWLPDSKMRARQFLQLAPLIAHAAKTVPYYQARLAAAGFASGEAVSPETWAALPILTRQEAQVAGAALFSIAVPAA